MHSLTVVFGPNGGAIQFMFKERADAMKMAKSINSTATDFITIEDDFGQHAEIKFSSIHGFSLEDLAQSGDAQIERTMQSARNQTKLNNKAAQDPMLKFSAANGAFAMNHPGNPAGRRPI